MSHVHSEACNHAPHALRNNAARKDPTHTTRVRIQFEQNINARFRRLKGIIRKALLDQDVMGVKTNATVPGTRAFEFLRSGDKVAAFMTWLKAQEDDLIFDIRVGTPVASASNQHWANVYIDTAYQKGLASAATQLRKGGVEVEQRWIDSAFFRPVHADRIGLIYTRVYTELVGITEAMDQQVSRVLAQGIAEGRGMMDIARSINERVDAIGRTRARTLARTEVISAHAEASLNSYQEAGLEGVRVQAEWTTAGDDQVCPDCQALEGKTYKMDEARGLIPLHPNCRCAWLPVIESPEGLRLS